PLRMQMDVLLDPGYTVEPQISLADPRTYESYGIAPPPQADFILEVSSPEDRLRRVSIRSRRPLREPIFFLLLQVDQGGRRMIREIPVLIDMPGSREEEPPRLAALPAQAEAAPARESPALQSRTTVAAPALPALQRFRLSQALDSLRVLPDALTLATERPAAAAEEDKPATAETPLPPEARRPALALELDPPATAALPRVDRQLRLTPTIWLLLVLLAGSAAGVLWYARHLRKSTVARWRDEGSYSSGALS
ncbi:MAG TPA: hypothetical protein VLI06_07535, partial [Solimonas sp.]|nr:hypothetical protein [Solimonas sp.]